EPSAARHSRRTTMKAIRWRAAVLVLLAMGTLPIGKVDGERVPDQLPRGTRSADRADGEPVAFDETPVVRALRKLDARIPFAGGDKGGPVTYVHLWGRKVTDKDLRQVALLQHLRDLTLGEMDITDRGLRQLVALQDLRKLELWCCPEITDAGLKEVAKL